MLSYFFPNSKIYFRKIFHWFILIEKIRFKLNIKYLIFILTLCFLLKNSLISIHHSIYLQNFKQAFLILLQKVRYKIQPWFWIVLHLELDFECSMTWILQRTHNSRVGHWHLKEDLLASWLLNIFTTVLQNRLRICSLQRSLLLKSHIFIHKQTFKIKNKL